MTGEEWKEGNEKDRLTFDAHLISLPELRARYRRRKRQSIWAAIKVFKSHGGPLAEQAIERFKLALETPDRTGEHV